MYFSASCAGCPSGPLAQRNDRLDASAGQALAQPAGIECLVADKSQAGDAGHENVKAGDVVTLAGRSTKRTRLPSASTSAAIFVVRPPRDLPMA